MLPPASVQRLLCNGRVTPIIMYSDWNPFSLGFSVRHASLRQRPVLRAIYRTCGFPGCDVGIRKCEFHHILPWELGGAIDLANLVHFKADLSRRAQKCRIGQGRRPFPWPIRVVRHTGCLRSERLAKTSMFRGCPRYRVTTCGRPNRSPGGVRSIDPTIRGSRTILDGNLRLRRNYIR
jgi:hypothetical protein